MNGEPERSFKRHTAKPLRDFRSARLSVGGGSPEDWKHFVAVCRRQDEIALLETMLNKLDPPAAIDGRKLSPAEVQAYCLAVNFARGTARNPGEFPRLVSIQTGKASVRFFKICAAAMEAVQAERARKYSATDGHRMAALQAKLELQQNTGELPTMLQVKKRAFSILQRFCKKQDFAPLEPENKRWSKILKSVNLDYLPEAVKGKS
jgi:hypothetical protein